MYEMIQASKHELSVLKNKLSEAFTKLQTQINLNTLLERQNEELLMNESMYKEALEDERREKVNLQNELQEQIIKNKQLQEAIEAIIKNRKLLQSQYQLLEHSNLNLKEKIKKYQEQINTYANKIEIYEDTINDCEEKYKDYQTTIAQYQNKIEIYQTKIAMYEMMCRTKGTKNINFNDSEWNKQNNSSECNPNYKQRAKKTALVHKKNQEISNKSIFTQFGQKNYVFNNQDKNDKNDNQNININSQRETGQKNDMMKSTDTERTLTDDQKLSQCQIDRKNTEQKLFKLQQIKRLTPNERTQMERLQRQIYDLDSMISGLKRKIRSKY